MSIIGMVGNASVQNNNMIFLCSFCFSERTILGHCQGFEFCSVTGSIGFSFKTWWI